MLWDDALNMFDGVYLSWDPAMFKSSLAFHGYVISLHRPLYLRSWGAEGCGSGVTQKTVSLSLNSSCEPSEDQTLVVSKQFNMLFTNESQSDEEVWVLLTRHTPDTRRTQDFIALRVQVEDESQGNAPLAQQTMRSKVRLLASRVVGMTASD